MVIANYKESVGDTRITNIMKEKTSFRVNKVSNYNKNG